jgi:carboxypeptidase Taq
MTPQQAYDALIKETHEIGILHSCGDLLSWDEHTYMPAAATEHRGNQSALIARLCHEMFTSPRIGELLATINGSDLVKDLHSDTGANVTQLKRSYDRQTKLPGSLVEEQAKTAVLSQQAWAEARKKNDFPSFAPHLKKVMDLKRQEAKCVGFKEHIYDALLDDYEMNETATGVRKVFESLRDPLIELVGKIVGSSKKAPVEILERKYPKELQEKFSREAAEAIGFDFNAGRLDVTVHPFCSSPGAGDTRMTTRYDENFFGDAFFSVLHEAGHALYEQGLDKANHFGEPIATSVSLGIHESQSRMWENLVGRSRSFWKHFFPKAKAAFGDIVKDVSEEQWVFAVNDIRPSFIRTESDEATYNLHVLIRFEMELAILTEELKIEDVPAAWNEKYKKYLGITPPDDAKGCMQDVHWSAGLVGYFPTYTLGNLYSAQFFEQARKDLGDLDAMFARGEFKTLLTWLRKNIHSQGSRYTPRELVKKVTGEDLKADALLTHLRNKARELYGV